MFLQHSSNFIEPKNFIYLTKCFLLWPAVYQQHVSGPQRFTGIPASPLAPCRSASAVPDAHDGTFQCLSRLHYLIPPHPQNWETLTCPNPCTREDRFNRYTQITPIVLSCLSVFVCLIIRNVTSILVSFSRNFGSTSPTLPPEKTSESSHTLSGITKTEPNRVSSHTDTHACIYCILCVMWLFFITSSLTDGHEANHTHIRRAEEEV